MLKTRVNHQITAREVRVINEEGQQIGVMPIGQALTLADEHGLDLVEVSPQAQPPVAKLIDIAKFRYQQKKLEQLQKKRTKKTEVKTIWISMRISEHDMEIKAKKVMEFLTDGDLVKIELRMRGREQAFGDLAQKQLKTFMVFITTPYRTEVPIKRMGGTFSTMVAPTATK
jgi:translation initiation factor IF-3